MRSVLKDRPDLTAQQLQRTRELMDLSVPDCLVTGYEGLINNLNLPDPDDRHVFAAAISCQAGVIVTYNLKDYPLAALASHGIEAQHPDDFVSHLHDLAPAAVCAAVRGPRSARGVEESSAVGARAARYVSFFGARRDRCAAGEHARASVTSGEPSYSHTVAQHRLHHINRIDHRVQRYVEASGETQAQAAKHLGLTQPRLNDLLINRCPGFCWILSWILTSEDEVRDAFAKWGVQWSSKGASTA